MAKKPTIKSPAALPEGVAFIESSRDFLIGVTGDAVAAIEAAKDRGSGTMWDNLKPDSVVVEIGEENPTKRGKRSGAIIKLTEAAFNAKLKSAASLNHVDFVTIHAAALPKSLNPPDHVGMIDRMDEVPDVRLKNISLQDLVALVKRSDVERPAGLKQFCDEVQQLGKKPSKTVQAALQPRLSDEEQALAAELRSRNLPSWSERKQRHDELRMLKAPYYFAKVYADFMGPVLTRKVLNAVDPDLVGGITNWQSTHGELPEGIMLPNAHTDSKKWVERVQAGQSVPQESDPTALMRNASRLRRAEKNKIPARS